MHAWSLSVPTSAAFGDVEQDLLDRALRKSRKTRIRLRVVWNGDHSLMQGEASRTTPGLVIDVQERPILLPTRGTEDAPEMPS